MPIEVKRTWDGGPLREWAAKRPNGNWGIPHQKGGYAGRYVCDECLSPVNGLYEPKIGFGDGRKWLCSDCRTLLKHKQAVPAGLRRKS